MMFQFDLLYVPVLTFSVTDFCTLKCKDCSLKVPYIKDKRHKTLEEVKQEISSIFNLIDYSTEIAFIGGEPTIWPHMAKLIVWLNKQYGDRYGEARLVSNGTVELSDEIVQVAAENHFVIEISVYDEYSKQINQINKKCTANEVEIREYRYKKWADFGLKSEIIHSVSGSRYLYLLCQSLCRMVDGNRFIFCGPGYFSSVRMGFDLNDNFGSCNMSEIDKKELYYRYYGITGNDYPGYCAYCNGFIGVAPEIPVAEQIE